MNKKILYTTAFVALFNTANGAEQPYSQSAASAQSTYTSLLTDSDNIPAESLSSSLLFTPESTIESLSQSQLAHETAGTTESTSSQSDYDDVVAGSLSSGLLFTPESATESLSQSNISQLAHETETTINVPTPPNVILDLYENIPLLQQDYIDQMQMLAHDLFHSQSIGYNNLGS